MALFNRIYKEGKGVRKDEPEKKTFFRFWEQFGRKFWNLITLNLLYILLCLPIVTIGAATAGFVYVLRNYALGKPVFLKDDFFGAIKRNWKQATLIWILQLFAIVLDTFAIYFYGSIVIGMDDSSSTSMFIIFLLGLAISIGIGIVLLFMSFYIYLMMVSFDFKTKSLIKNAFLFSGLGVKVNFINLLSYLLFFALGALLISIRIILPIGVMYFVLLTAPFCGFLAVFNSFPLIRKHIIDPYYEERGLENPLDPKHSEEEAIFQDDVTMRAHQSESETENQ